MDEIYDITIERYPHEFMCKREPCTCSDERKNHRRILRTTLEATKEEFVQLVEKLAGPEGRDLFWAEIEKMGKSARRDGPQAQAKRDGRDALARIITAALKSLNEEQ